MIFVTINIFIYCYLFWGRVMDIYSFLDKYNNVEYGIDHELFSNYTESLLSQDFDKVIFKLLSKISEIGFRFNEGKIIYNPLFFI